MLDIQPTKDPEARRLLSRGHDLAVEIEDLNRQLAQHNCRQDLAALVDGTRERLEGQIAITQRKFDEVKKQLKKYGSVILRREL